MIKQFTLAAGIGAALLGAVDPASAHARLKSARPAVGSTVTAAPASITLEFSEGVVPNFSGIALSDAGKPVQIGKAAKGDDPATLTASIATKLAPGTYTVTWHAVSVDSHRTQGSFRFTVAP